jgi:hypothetical protein
MKTTNLKKIGASLTLLEVKHKRVWFSYEVPVAFHDGTRIWVRQNEWGATTGKHLNEIDGGDKLAKANRYPGPEFEQMLKTEFKL